MAVGWEQATIIQEDWIEGEEVQKKPRRRKAAKHRNRFAALLRKKEVRR